METNFKNQSLYKVFFLGIFILFFNSSFLIAQGGKKASTTNKQVKTKKAQVTTTVEAPVPIKIDKKERVTAKTVESDQNKTAPANQKTGSKK